MNLPVTGFFEMNPYKASFVRRRRGESLQVWTAWTRRRG